MLKYISVVLLLVTAALSPFASEAKVVDEHVYLVPAGEVENKTVEEIKKALPADLPMVVRVGIEPREALPETAYDASRKQYDAGAVLNDIWRRITITTANERALVVTDADLYVPGSDFVYGLADEKKGMCIMSLARLKDGAVIKEALHELGLSWGLPECANPKCVMHASRSFSQSPGRKDKICRECQKALRLRYSRPLISLPSI